ncbi:MAG: ribulose-phosphate 3-epimerase [Candidatus Kapaibacterium sp.]|nr:MAG: ribulose-phosphate 3-epimerase [Candidatus Kapabacteria bacterium]
MRDQILIAPSLLSADFTKLGQQVVACQEADADLLHLDIMDGRFVPNITFGPAIIAAVRKVTSLPLDCHLMIIEPERYLQTFREAGADWISVHAETCVHLHRTLEQIRALGAKAGIVLNPLTPLEYAFEAAPWADFVLLMSVNPGFGGQQFIPSVLQRIERLRNWLERSGLEIPIEVDGGITAATVADVVRAGASILVSGAGVFGGSSIAESIRALRQAAQR